MISDSTPLNNFMRKQEYILKPILKLTFYFDIHFSCQGLVEVFCCTDVPSGLFCRCVRNEKRGRSGAVAQGCVEVRFGPGDKKWRKSVKAAGQIERMTLRYFFLSSDFKSLLIFKMRFKEILIIKQTTIFT